MHSRDRKQPMLSIKTPFKFTEQSKSNPSSPRTERGNVSQRGHVSPLRYMMEVKRDGNVGSTLYSCLTKIIFIFMYYTSYGDKLNICSLKSSKFHKLLTDANIENENNKINYELMFSSKCKTGSMNFEMFLQTLCKIAPISYPTTTIQKALDLLVTQNIVPLYNYIENYMRSNAFGHVKEELTWQQPIISIMQCIDKPLYDIYCAYYPFEFSTSQTIEHKFQQSMAATFTFLYDFEIVPSMITKPASFYLFQSVINKDDCDKLSYARMHKSIGGLFTYLKFIELIVRISVCIKMLCGMTPEGAILIRASEKVFRKNRIKQWLQ